MGRAAVLVAVGLLSPAPASEAPPVVLNEIHYHPPAGAGPAEEFIELHNRTDSAVDLHGFEVRGGVRFRFDRARGASSIAPRGYLLVARSPESLARAVGIPAREIAGPFTGRLSNFKDRIVLADPGGRELESVEYAQDGPWPARADGLGSSLERIASDAPAAWPRNWSVAVGAAPAARERVLFETGAPVRWFESRQGSDPGFAGGLPWYHPDFDDRQGGWKEGRLAVGFDLVGRRLQQWIHTDATPLRGLHSILVRVAFEAPEPEGDEVPALFLDWDDGFIAWLNGVEIARRAMRIPPGVPPPWNAGYLADLVEAGGDQSEDVSWERVWTGKREALRRGRNVLAIGNYNANARSTDLFATAKLVLARPGSAASFTPGRANSVAAASPPPLPTFAARTPSEPGSRDAVILRALVEGKEIERVDLIYDLGAGERRSPMQDDGLGPDGLAGDGVFAAVVPPAPDLTVVRFRVEARDPWGGVGRFPREGNPSPHAGYYVCDARPRQNEDLDAYHLLWTGPLSCARGAYRRGSVFVHRGTAHLGVGVKYRGDTSCGLPKSGLRVAFNRGDLFQGRRQLNLLGCWQDKTVLREKLAWDLFRDLGHPHLQAQHAAVYTAGARFHGLFIALEDPGADSLRRNGLDPSDALWKCRNSLADPRHPGYGSFAKLTALDDEADEAEFLEFARQLHAFEGERHLAWVLENIDVEALIDYQAVKSVISDEDGFTKNWMLFHGTRKGAGGKTLHRWTAHPWDLDLSFGQIELGSDELLTETHPLVGTIDHPRHGRTGTSWNGLLEAVFGRRSGDFFIKALYGRIGSLLAEKFSPEVLGAKIDRLDAHTAEPARADLERWPRWGLEPTNAAFHRERLRRYCIDRHAFLRDFLAVEGPTTAREVDPRPRSEFPDFDGRVFAPPARTWRSFRYTPAPRLKITEVHYHPAGDEDLEFIELRNLEARAVDLSGWDLPAVGYVFPKGSAAPGGAVLVVARDPVKLGTRHPRVEKARLFGPYPGRLGNAGEELRLRDGGLHEGKRCFPETVDVLRYRDAPPWPREADGGGPSLELRAVALDNDLPESWRASAEPGGTPGD